MERASHFLRGRTEKQPYLVVRAYGVRAGFALEVRTMRTQIRPTPVEHEGRLYFMGQRLLRDPVKMSGQLWSVAAGFLVCDASLDVQ